MRLHADGRSLRRPAERGPRGNRTARWVPIPNIVVMADPFRNASEHWTERRESVPKSVTGAALRWLPSWGFAPAWRLGSLATSVRHTGRRLVDVNASRWRTPGSAVRGSPSTSGEGPRAVNAICSEAMAKAISNAEPFLFALPPIKVVSPCPVLLNVTGVSKQLPDTTENPEFLPEAAVSLMSRSRKPSSYY
jgi:hypothetical protein